jgi:hypothetical protein
VWFATSEIDRHVSGNGKRERGSSFHYSAEGAIGSVIRLRLRSVLAHFAEGPRFLP